MIKSKWNAGGCSAFTLVEILVVMAIMAVLALGAVPAIQSIVDSQDIQAGAAILRDQLQTARQIAITRNHPIQCRFYLSGNGYSSIRSVLDGTETPVTRLVFLPGRIIISNNQSYSTLLASSDVSSSSDSTGPYLAFTFRADGSTDLSFDLTYTMTLLVSRNNVAITQLPSNFITLQLDSETGKTVFFQP